MGKNTQVFKTGCSLRMWKIKNRQLEGVVTMERLKLRIILLALILVLSLHTFAVSAWANSAGEKVLVLDFLTLDNEGDYVDTLAHKVPELVSLSRVMAQGVAAKLVQYGEFDVQDNISMRNEIADMGFTYQTSAWERAQTLLQEGLVEQVITGSVTMLQTTTVVGVQRFQMINGVPALVGSAMGTTARVTDAPTLIDTLVASVFPPDVQVIERSIEQVFAVPGHLRLNLGQSNPITVYALDALGRPVANPQFLFFSSDESKVEVDEHGVVKGIQPGTATITVRAISRTARSGSPATMSVTVVPPTFGVRVGSLLTHRDKTEGYPLRLGLRLTPTMDQRGTQQKTTTPAATPNPTEPSNPLTLIASYFGSMLTNGLMTIDLDLDPTREILVAFSGVQRSSGGYIGTGVGYVSPMDNFEAQKGFVLRLTVGTQYRTGNRISIPIEAVMDAIFPTSSSFSPSFRIGVNVGLDLFP